MKTLKLQNTKTKTLQSSQEEKQICLPPVKLHIKKIKDPQNDKKKIENSRTSKYQN
jgi:hypothetical protein